MNFIKRLSMLVYMFLMFVSGALFLAISSGMISTEYMAETVSVINTTIGYQVAIGVAGALLIVIGIIAPYRLEKKIKKNRKISFQNPDGEVTVSLLAVEDYIRKIAKSISGIKDVRAHVEISKKGIDVIIGVSTSATANIPEVTERIQMEVKNKVQGMLGVEENVNVKMHITKIAKGAYHAEGHLEGDIPSPSQVPPFREME